MNSAGPVAAYVALGSNLEDPVAQVKAAIGDLARLPATRVAAISSLYRNPAVGGPPQPDFVNAVVMLETRLSARSLLELLLAIEEVHGRLRSVPNAPRTLDLDIALFGESVITEPGLTVPHPRLCERAFVLIPLAEIAPDAAVPGKGRVACLARLVDAARMTRIPRA